MKYDNKLQVLANVTGNLNITEIVRPNLIEDTGKFTLPINFKRNVLLKSALGVTFLVMVAVAGSQSENLKSSSPSTQNLTINLKVAQPSSSVSADSSDTSASSSKSNSSEDPALEPSVTTAEQTLNRGQYSSYRYEGAPTTNYLPRYNY